MTGTGTETFMERVRLTSPPCILQQCPSLFRVFGKLETHGGLIEMIEFVSGLFAGTLLHIVWDAYKSLRFEIQEWHYDARRRRYRKR